MMDTFIQPICKICVDKTSHQYGWIFIKDPSGKWIPAASLSDKMVKIAEKSMECSGKTADFPSYYDIYNPKP